MLLCSDKMYRFLVTCVVLLAGQAGSTSASPVQGLTVWPSLVPAGSPVVVRVSAFPVGSLSLNDTLTLTSPWGAVGPWSLVVVPVPGLASSSPLGVVLPSLPAGAALLSAGAAGGAGGETWLQVYAVPHFNAVEPALAAVGTAGLTTLVLIAAPASAAAVFSAPAPGPGVLVVCEPVGGAPAPAVVVVADVGDRRAHV